MRNTTWSPDALYRPPALLVYLILTVSVAIPAIIHARDQARHQGTVTKYHSGAATVMVQPTGALKRSSPALTASFAAPGSSAGEFGTYRVSVDGKTLDLGWAGSVGGTYGLEIGGSVAGGELSPDGLWVEATLHSPEGPPGSVEHVSWNAVTAGSGSCRVDLSEATESRVSGTFECSGVEPSSGGATFDMRGEFSASSSAATASPEPSGEAFIGTWQNTDRNLEIAINADGSWERVGAGYGGTWEPYAGGLTLWWTNGDFAYDARMRGAVLVLQTGHQSRELTRLP